MYNLQNNLGLPSLPLARMLTSILPFVAVAVPTVLVAGDVSNTATVTAPGQAIETNVADNAITEIDTLFAVIVADSDRASNVNGAVGAPAVLNVLDGDTLNGAPAALDTVDIRVVTAAVAANAGDSVPTLNPATGLVDVPAGTPAGTYTITYEICEELNPTNCAQNTVTIEVSASPIVAVGDVAAGVNGADGAIAVVNVFTGDTVNGLAADPTNVLLSVADGSAVPTQLIFDPATGNVDVAAGTPAGTYSFDYQICETLNPDNCVTATISVEVAAADIVADVDTPDPVNGADGGGAIVNVLSNDELNGVPVTLETVELTIQTTATPAFQGAPIPTLDPATGLVDVPSGTPAGSYAITYQICEILNPTNCATSTVTIEILAPEIVASADEPEPVRAGTGSNIALNVFANDTLNGKPVDPAHITATIASPAANPGVVLDPATGTVSVSPDVPAGTYTIEYQICETLNPTNCATSTVTIVVEPARSGIEGTVYTDNNANGGLDNGDTRRGNWIVEVRRNGEVIATVRTDTNGNYAVADLLSGDGYDIVFRNPENNVVYDIIKDLTLAANTTVIDQNLPIDPSGIFYDSVARTPIAGVTATLLDRNGNTLPTICYLDPSQSNQITGASGEYRFDIIPGAATQCPVGESEYSISITPPNGFNDLSTVIAPQPGPFDPTGLAAPVRINPEPTVPTVANPPYYLTFRLEAGDPDIIFNHIPLDPFLTRTPLIVTKTSFKRSANVGDVVPYEITVRNTENVQRSGVNVVDILPAGMKYVLGTGVVAGAATEPTVNDRTVLWSGQVIPANGSVSYNLTLVIGAGVTGGEKVNTGLAQNGADGSAISNRGTAVVSIVPSAVFDCSELLGKVFEDANRNGYQDENEPGVPGVRLATVNGQLITTDEFGRYHIACAAVPDARIGSNFVLKVDTRTLPLGWDTTTDNPRSMRLTRGKFGELNFGVAPAETETSLGTPASTRDGVGGEKLP
ncbi:hypothetical protein GCM10023115_23860 [Pontixanthobacter gangjinensis]|uniref:DUF11 domain-containing protein n=1 Tax=Pontixanthobacter gangjinensis TaxID=1028742 RepID=A0A6I4SSX5_9SPHN|nr:DUF11 domain-containing protein [Pontixanthobacter gangjinensis]MXO57632.1 DUF11 domain-containing protein [Pontixanthobacter gangjinensis]